MGEFTRRILKRGAGSTFLYQNEKEAPIERKLAMRVDEQLNFR